MHEVVTDRLPHQRSCCVRSCHLHRRAPVAEETVHFVSGLLAAERRRRGTRGGAGRWAATGRRCWCCAGFSTAPGWPSWPPTTDRPLDGLPLSARGHRRPRRGRTRAARVRCWPPAPPGHAHVTVGGTLLRTDRCHAPGPTARADRPTARWTCGGRASTPATAATCRSSPPRRLAGRSSYAKVGGATSTLLIRQRGCCPACGTPLLHAMRNPNPRTTGNGGPAPSRRPCARRPSRRSARTARRTIRPRAVSYTPTAPAGRHWAQHAQPDALVACLSRMR
jgi:hypothetical protein